MADPNEVVVDANIEPTNPVLLEEIERLSKVVTDDEENTSTETEDAESESVETEDSGTELVTDTRGSDEEKAKVSSEEEKSIARIATKEREVNEKVNKFEAREKAFKAVEAKLVNPDDLRNNPTAVLKAKGLDPELVMKQILFEKLPDDSPVKAKLKDELADYHRSKEIADLRREIAAKDEAAASQRQYQETISTIEKYANTFKEDNKELATALPVLSKIGKKDPAFLKDLIVKEIVDDVRHRYITGEGGDPITHEEAAKRVNTTLAKLATFLIDNKTEVKKQTSTLATKKVVPGNLTKDVKPQTINGAVDELIASTIAEFNKSEVKQGRR